jgi:hypothetical protein
MKKLLIGLLAFGGISSSFAQVYKGIDTNGNNCEMEIVNDELIAYETPERELGSRSGGQYLSTTERITTVNFKYLKESWFKTEEQVIRGFKVRSTHNTMWSGYSYIQSHGFSNDNANRDLGFDEDIELETYFDTNKKFGELEGYVFERYDDGKVYVDCSISSRH